MTSRPERRIYSTTSMCPTCLELVPGEVVVRDDRILMGRTCPRHGRFEGLVCSDLAWYESLPKFDVPGVEPGGARRPVAQGCPLDCGLCVSHGQIAGTAAIEISNHCNSRCPACLADNRGTFQLGAKDVEREVEQLLAGQDHVDAVVLSGGEPTIHPELFEMIDVLQRREIGRVVINSNGIEIARDDALLDRLARYPNVYVCLHYDGPRSEALRGIPHETQERALERLCERKIPVVPLVLAARGVNEGDLGAVVCDLLTRSPMIRSVTVSLMTYTGSRGLTFPGDPLTRLTIPDAVASIEESSRGRIGRRDFMPLPMPNPLCAAVGYFMILDGEPTGLISLAEIDRIIDFTKNSNFGQVDRALEVLLREVMDDIYANPDRYPSSQALLGKFRRLVNLLFPEDRALDDGERRRLGEETMKLVYLMQFMDPWTFDSNRLRKCSCQHLLPGGQRIPSCGYYAYHRRHDPRFERSSPAS